MKKFNLSEKLSNKKTTWILYSGLLLSLGFNLSWNPEQPHLARNENLTQSFEYASKDDSQQPQAGPQLPPSGPQLPPAPPAAAEHTTPQPRAGTPKMQPARPGAATPHQAAESKESPVEAKPLEVVPPALRAQQDIRSGKIKFENDSNLSSLEVAYAVNSNSDRLILQVEGKSICDECSNYQELAIKKEDVKNLEFLKMAVAKHLTDLMSKNRKKDQKSGSGHDDKKEQVADAKSEIDKKIKSLANPKSTCPRASRRTDISERLDCLTDEFANLKEKCDEINTDELSEKQADKIERSCMRGIENYFSKYLAKTLQAGLQADPNSEYYRSSVTARDSIIAELSPEQSPIAKLLTVFSGQSVISRAQNFEQILQKQCLELGQTNCQIISNPRTRDYLRQELQSSSSLRMALQQSQNGNIYTQNFETPLMNLIRQDSRNSQSPINWTSAMASFDAGMPASYVQSGPNTGSGPNQYQNSGANRPIDNGPMLPGQAQQFGAGNQFGGVPGAPMMQPPRQQPISQPNTRVRTAF